MKKNKKYGCSHFETGAAWSVVSSVTGNLSETRSGSEIVSWHMSPISAFRLGQNLAS